MLIAIIYAPLTYKLNIDIINISNSQTKKFFIEIQKSILKNQVHNFINYLDYLRKIKTQEIIKKFDNILSIPQHNIIMSKSPQYTLKEISKKLKIKLIYIRNNQIVFPKNIKKLKLNLNQHIQKINNNYYIIKKINKNSYLIGIISNKLIKDFIRKEAIKYVSLIKFGANNKGHLMILDLEKRYLLSLNSPNVLLNRSSQLIYKKSYPILNWVIIGSIPLSDINQIIKNKNILMFNTIKKYFIIFILIYVILSIIIFFILRYEINIFARLIDDYEYKIKIQNKKLKQLNKNLLELVKQKTKEILDKYFTDNLTKLPNREKLLTELKNKDFIAILNINSFKEINDFYGINIGDEILKKISLILLNFSKKVYKLSNDEFVIIDNNIKRLENTIKTIHDYFFKNPIIINNEKIHITFNTGIGKTLQEADLALKYSKSKNIPFTIFNEKLPILKDFENNIKWRQILYEVIEKENVIPYVQEIVDNKNKKFKKYECLMRIKHDEKIFTPYFFLDIARKTNQYETLQKIMIEKCFKKFSLIKKPFSINLDTLDLENKQFQEWLIKQMDKYKISNLLTVELLENQNILNEDIKHFLNKLKEKNIEIAIDDFGSGYSNFIYLIRDLPIDTLKIDGSIVKEIDKKEIYILLKKIIEIAKEFKFNTIAEFVENEKIYKKLQEIGVDASQGYYFSKPFNLDEL